MFIALAINEWNMQREREHLAENVRVTIKEELLFNTAQVQKAFDYHLPMMKELMTGNHRMYSIPMRKENIAVVTPERLEKKLLELFERFGMVVEAPLKVKKIRDSTYSFRYMGQLLSIRIVHDTMKIYGKGNISLHSALVRNNAWRIAQAAQIAPYLDFKLIALMSEIDQLHVEYGQTTGRIVDMLYSGGSDITPAMQDLIYYEKALLQKYSELDSLLMH